MKQATPRILGFAGLLPFAVLSLLTLIGPETWRDWVSVALIAYGAVILSFLGGTTWGLAVHENETRSPIYLLSMAPFFAAWVALLLPPFFGLMLLTAAFLGALFNDYLLKRSGLSPGWFLSLRVLLTLVVVFFLGLAAFGV